VLLPADLSFFFLFCCCCCCCSLLSSQDGGFGGVDVDNTLAARERSRGVLGVGMDSFPVRA